MSQAGTECSRVARRKHCPLQVYLQEGSAFFLRKCGRAFVHIWRMSFMSEGRRPGANDDAINVKISMNEKTVKRIDKIK